VDCGEGTQRQLLRSGVGFRRLDRLLLTHGHFDHDSAFPVSFRLCDCGRAPTS
jgi:ribonuclease Z